MGKKGQKISFDVNMQKSETCCLWRMQNNCEFQTDLPKGRQEIVWMGNFAGPAEPRGLEGHQPPGPQFLVFSYSIKKISFKWPKLWTVNDVTGKDPLERDLYSFCGEHFIWKDPSKAVKTPWSAFEGPFLVKCPSGSFQVVFGNVH